MRAVANGVSAQRAANVHAGDESARMLLPTRSTHVMVVPEHRLVHRFLQLLDLVGVARTSSRRRWASQAVMLSLILAWCAVEWGRFSGTAMSIGLSSLNVYFLVNAVWFLWLMRPDRTDRSTWHFWAALDFTARFCRPSLLADISRLASGWCVFIVVVTTASAVFAVTGNGPIGALSVVGNLFGWVAHCSVTLVMCMHRAHGDETAARLAELGCGPSERASVDRASERAADSEDASRSPPAGGPGRVTEAVVIRHFDAMSALVSRTNRYFEEYIILFYTTGVLVRLVSRLSSRRLMCPPHPTALIVFVTLLSVLATANMSQQERAGLLVGMLISFAYVAYAAYMMSAVVKPFRQAAFLAARLDCLSPAEVHLLDVRIFSSACVCVCVSVCRDAGCLCAEDERDAVDVAAPGPHRRAGPAADDLHVRQILLARHHRCTCAPAVALSGTMLHSTAHERSLEQTVYAAQASFSKQ